MYLSKETIIVNSLTSTGSDILARCIEFGPFDGVLPTFSSKTIVVLALRKACSCCVTPCFASSKICVPFPKIVLLCHGNF